MSWFAAVQVPPVTAGEVTDAVGRFTDLGRYTVEAADRLHITLCFYGSVEAAAEEPLELELSRVAASMPAFPLSIEGGGAFPGARVVWAGVAGDLGALGRLQRASWEETARLGSASRSEDPASRSYVPHVTVARWSDHRVDVSPLVHHLVDTVHTPQFVVDRVTLFVSAGGRFTVRSVHPLGAPT